MNIDLLRDRIINRSRQFGPALAVVVVAGSVGLFSLQAGNAATYAADQEAESGARSGNQQPGDAVGASGGASVKFGTTVASTGKKFIKGVSSNGRYFVDQNGDPFLLLGDSPWGMFADASAAQVETWAANRESHGINSAIISLIGAPENGGRFASGATYDGVLPFNGGNVTSWNEAYWTRIDAMMTSLKNHGITVFLYPIDGWTIMTGNSFSRTSNADNVAYGKMVAQRYASYPNIVWMTGGDYNGSDITINTMLQSVIDGIRSTGDTRIAGMQPGAEMLTTDSAFFEQRVNWNFAYSYRTPYAYVLAGYNRPAGARDPRPVLLGESHYEDEGGATDDLLRRQELWSLTSGGGGDFAGSADWLFNAGWQNRLDTTWITQSQKIHSFFASTNWYQLVPDTASPLITAGRGTFRATSYTGDDSQNDYVTAAQTADKSLSIVYVPTGASNSNARTITLDLSRLPTSYTATWIDPTNATGTGQPASINSSGNVTTPGLHTDGSRDWLLVIR